MTLPQNDLRLSMFEPGQVWYMDDPIRVVKILEPTTIEYVDKTGEIPEPKTRPAMVALVTIPTKPIEGFVTERQAEAGGLIAHGLTAPSDDGQELPSGHWQEVYAERVVHQIIRSTSKARKGVVVPDEGPLEHQLYCHEERGATKRQTASSVKNRPITGQLIPAEAVPPGLFKELQEHVEPDKPSVDVDALSYRDLQKLAKEQGINPFGAKKVDLLSQLKAKLTAAAA